MLSAITKAVCNTVGEVYRAVMGTNGVGYQAAYAIETPVALGVDGQVARLRAIMVETRSALSAMEQRQMSATRQIAAADYALRHVRRACGGLLPPRLTIVEVPVPALTSAPSRGMIAQLAA